MQKSLDGIFRLHRIEDQMGMEKMKKGTERSVQLATTGIPGCYGRLYGDQVLHRRKKIADELKDEYCFFAKWCWDKAKEKRELNLPQ